MGIVKVNIRRFDNSGDFSESSFTCKEDKVQKNEVLDYNELDDDFHGGEFAEVDSELVVLGDKMFNVPYSLYDLPNLKDVLSLEAWNICLSEDDRLLLSAYLPDMDQQTFSVTMNELLKGENLFFGSPLECFFQRLNGGLYALEVSSFRKGLQFLEKQKYYHSLRSYIDGMAGVFTDMRETWRSCQSSVSIEERISIWKKHKNNKPVFPVDLNSLPVDEELFTRTKKDKDTSQSIRTRYMDGKQDLRHPVLDPVSTTAAVAPITQPRGVLKIKPLGTNSNQTGALQATPCDNWGTKPTPKGVLKVKPRIAALHSQEKRRPSPIQQEMACNSENIHAARFSYGIQPTNIEDMNFVKDSGFLLSNRDMNSSSSEFPWHLTNLSRGDPLTKSNCMESKHKIFPWKTSKTGVGHPSIFEALKKNPLGINVQKWDLNTQTIIPGGFQDKRHMTPSFPEGMLRASTTTGDEHKPLRLESRQEDTSIPSLTKNREADIPAISGTRVFPITYKRKKCSSKQNTSETFKHQITEGYSESKFSEGTDYSAAVKEKPVKVKLKLWKK